MVDGRDKFGSSGTFKGGKFVALPKAQEQQKRAVSAAERQQREREQQRAELDKLTLDELKARHSDVDFGSATRKADIIERILDSEA